MGGVDEPLNCMQRSKKINNLTGVLQNREGCSCPHNCSHLPNNLLSEYAIFLISLAMISKLNPNDKDFFAKRILEKEKRRMSQFRQAMLSPPHIPQSLPKRKVIFSTP